jgi:hypothetical protein
MLGYSMNKQMIHIAKSHQAEAKAEIHICFVESVQERLLNWIKEVVCNELIVIATSVLIQCCVCNEFLHVENQPWLGNYCARTIIGMSKVFRNTLWPRISKCLELQILMSNNGTR